MQEKPTPGPWFYITDGGTDFTAIATKKEIVWGIDLDAEVLGSSEWLRASKPDLMLMAAAPDLLAALEEIAQINPYNTSIMEYVVAKAQAAIDKVRHNAMYATKPAE